MDFRQLAAQRAVNLNVPLLRYPSLTYLFQAKVITRRVLRICYGNVIMTVVIFILFFHFTASNDVFSTERFTPPSSIYNNVPGLMNDGNPDPFDTSHVYNPPLHRYYSHVSDVESSSAKYRNLENRNNAPSSSPVVLPDSFEDDYKEVFHNNVASPMKKLDSKFIAELEKNLGTEEIRANSSFPTLRPPPPTVKSSLKKQANFMSHPATKLNPRVNTWSAKSTNIHADRERPMSVCLPNSFNLQNDIPLPSALSAEDLNTATENGSEVNGEQRYSNDIADSEMLFNQMWITEQQNVQAEKKNNSNNIYKDVSNKCDKTPFNKELVSMLTKSSNRNIYDNTQNYCNATTGSVVDRYDLSEAFSEPHRYDLSATGDIRNRYDSGASMYERNLYSNAPNVYDAVPEEDLCETQEKNIYDSVAEDCNYYNFIGEEETQLDYRSHAPSNSVMEIKIFSVKKRKASVVIFYEIFSVLEIK